MNWGLLFNILKHSKVFIKLCRNYKARTSTVILALLAFTYTFYELSSFHQHQAKHKIIGDTNKLTKYVDNILKGCGDLTAISISSIDIVKSVKGEWKGDFVIVRACDKREKRNACIVNLKDRNSSLYNKPHKIRYNSYELFVGLGTNTLSSKKFNLRQNGEQNVDALHDYPSMLNIVKRLEWYQAGRLHNLWTTAIIKDILNEKYVLYIITFLSAKPTKDLSCFDQDAILNNIKNFIINN